MNALPPTDRRPLRVGLIAPPWVPVPPPEYGGTEVVVDLLARGLQRAHCSVLLFTTGDATCPVPRRWHAPRALGIGAGADAELEHLERAYRAMAGMDVIHDHTAAGPALLALHPPGVPVVATIHGSLPPAARRGCAAAAAGGVSLVAISHDQARRAAPLPIAAVIHHGVDVATFPVGGGERGDVVFLGRMSPDKGAHRAIDVARRAGRTILLAAKMSEPGEHRYFAEHIEPRLGADAVYVGEVGRRRKLELLAGATALLNPIRWPEPFGLVMIEALACGTPVLAFPEGAAPEIVDHGRTGFLCRDEDDMVARLGDVAHLDRAGCRASVEDWFSDRRMVEDHLALYRRIVGGAHPASSGRPLVTFGPGGTAGGAPP